MECDLPTLECYYLVIGGGIAGVSCVDYLYSFGDIENKQQKTILVSLSDYLKVATIKCHLTRTLEEMVPITHTWDGIFGKFKTFQFVNGILREIHPTKRKVVIQKGSTDNPSNKSNIHITYEKLVICTGAKPRMLDYHIDGAIVLRDEDSAIRLIEALKNSKNVCVIGNGGIALELVYTLQHCEITWVIRDNNIGNAYFDEATSLFLNEYISCNINNQQDTNSCQQNITTIHDRRHIVGLNDFNSYINQKFGYSLGPNWHKQINFDHIMENKPTKTLEIKLNSQVDNVSVNQSDHDHKYTVILSNGEKFYADVIIIAIGVVPNTTDFTVIDGDKALEKDSIGAINVNHLMESSIENIYAAGDCCSVNVSSANEYDSSGCWFQKRLWCQAKYMGQRAAEIILQSSPSALISMVPIQFELFSHFMRTFNLTVIMLGHYNIKEKSATNTEILLRIDRQKCEYIRCIVEQDRMIGAIMIGNSDGSFELAETFENLILNQTNLQSLKEHILDPEIDIADYFD